MSDEGRAVSAGLIYILRDPLHQDALIKIGHTTRTSEARAKEITSATGVPWGFEVIYEESVLDSRAAERLVHNRLAAHRVNQKREFFKLPLKDAVRVVFEVCMEVNSEFSNLADRIAICVTYGFDSRQFRELLTPFVGGSTLVTLIYVNDRASVSITMPEAWRISINPTFLLAIGDLVGVSEVVTFRGNPPTMENAK